MDQTSNIKLDKIIFMGTPEFAVPFLEYLINNSYKPILVITQPDRKKGRKQKIQSPPVKSLAEKFNIKIRQPEDVNDEKFVNYISDLKPDIIVTVAFGGYLKRSFRKIPKYGCINIHPSLLPKYRGSSPISFPILNGDNETGITIFKIVAKMDAGPILSQEKVNINNKINFTELELMLIERGKVLLINTLKKFENNKISLTKQDNSKASFTTKLQKKDTFLDWNNPAEKINNFVRAYSNYPGAIATYRDKRIKIKSINILDNKSDKKPGTIINIHKKIGLEVATLSNNILIKIVQPAGKKDMNSYDFHLGARIKIGDIFSNGN
jgi:methionyl-tRNA formyltransferase